MTHVKQNKTFYYLEITIPDATDDIIGTNMGLLEQHIAETNDKFSKVAKATVFASVKVHNIVENTQAVTLEFANERNYKTYIQAVSHFRAWVSENHNVTYTFEKVSTSPYDVLAKTVSDTAEGKRTYYDDLEDYMFKTLPASRGFA